MEYEFYKKTLYDHWCPSSFVYFKYSIVQEFKNSMTVEASFGMLLTVNKY